MTSDSLTYLIEGARLVAILDGGGGAVVEDGHRILVKEGRNYTEHARVTPGGAVLEYYCDFEIDGSPEPDCTVGVDAQIVISGTLSTGGWVEVRGAGELMYDEHGCVQGSFHDMPRVAVETRRSEPVPRDPEWSVEKWVEHMKTINPRTPEEFERAASGRDLDELPEDDVPQFDRD